MAAALLKHLGQMQAEFPASRGSSLGPIPVPAGATSCSIPQFVFGVPQSPAAYGRAPGATGSVLPHSALLVALLQVKTPEVLHSHLENPHG